MAAGVQNAGGGGDERRLTKQLARIVRSIQWSYAIFWCNNSNRQAGVLEWRDGYYNGDIRTRKATQSTNLRRDQWGLQRSTQLRDLYQSLSAAESNPQARRPSASLSPEDLTDAEWYYLVCMSFTFRNGQGLPGRTQSIGSEIWLCNASFADANVFSRSLLAKSASIQTIVCIPFMGGVLELGTTEHVLENQDLIKQLTSSFWSIPNSVCSELSMSGSLNAEEEEGQVPSDVGNVSSVLDHNIRTSTENGRRTAALRHGYHRVVDDAELINEVLVEEEKHTGETSEEPRTTGSPEYSSSGCFLNDQQQDDVDIDDDDDDDDDDDGHFGTKRAAAPQVRDFRFFDNELDHGLIHGSWNSGDRTSRSVPRKERADGPFLRGLKAASPKHGGFFRPPELGNHDEHYRSVISSLLRSTPPRLPSSVSPFQDPSRSSCFAGWNKGLGGAADHVLEPTHLPQQKMLKKILFDVARMHTSGPMVLGGDGSGVLDGRLMKRKPPDHTGFGHVTSEKWTTEKKLGDKFVILKSLVPTVKSKVDDAAVLEDTIDYVRELERRVQALESCREPPGDHHYHHDAQDRKRCHPDVAEKTSDNYGSGEDMGDGRNLQYNHKTKKKKDEGGEEVEEQYWVLSKDCSADITVSVSEKEVLIEMCCPWRELLLLEIVEAISNVRLVAHSLQSSTVDGVLYLSLRSKLQGCAPMVSPRMIKRALCGVVGKH